MSGAKGSKKREYGTGSVFDKHGSVTYKWRPFPGKPQVQRKVCRAGEMTKAQQAQKIAEIRAEYTPPNDSEVPSFAQVGSAHIKQLELDGKAKSYTQDCWRNLRNYLNPEFGDRPIDSIKPKDLNRFKSKLQQAGKGPSTIVRAIWLASGIFKYALEEEWRSEVNPVAAMAMPKYENKHKIVYMSPAEVNRVIAAVPNDDWGRVERPLYRAGQESGQRRSELVAIHWEECDFDLGVFRIMWAYVEGEFKLPKGKKARVVPMLPNLKETLLTWRKVTRYPADHDLVFADPITGGPLEPSKVTKRFNKALLNAGVGPSVIREYKNNGKIYKRRHPLWEFRDLRDTFASALMSNPTVAPREVQEALGHANLATTSARYGGFVPTIDLAERMAAAFPEDRSSIGPQSPEGATGQGGAAKGDAGTAEQSKAVSK